MSLIGRVRNRFRAIGARARLEREMQEEMLAHIEQAAKRFEARGMSPRDALLAARREFGQLGVVQEDARDARGARWLDALGGDVRFAFRYFARTPVTTATIVLTLTLGIGVTAAAFAIFTGVMSRPAPGVPDDSRLVMIRGISTADGRLSPRFLSYPELMDYARRPEFASVAGWAVSAVVIERNGETAGTAIAQYVTPNLFSTLGLRLSAGSGFVQSKADDHAPPELTAILAHSYALEMFGSAQNAVGQNVRVNGTPVRISGVAPPRFIGAVRGEIPRKLWIPVSAWPLLENLGSDAFTDRRTVAFSAIARLSDGVMIESTLPQVQLIASRAAAQWPRLATSPRRGPPAFAADVVPLRGDLDVRGYRSEDYMLGAMFAALVLLILLVCTTTVGSLLVGGAVIRRHEIGVRLAIGASRRRLVRQLLTESSLLALAGGAAGLAVYWGVCRILRDRLVDVDIDPSWTTALATAVFAMLAALLCGLSPALHATRVALSGVLKDSSMGATVRSRLQRTFVVAQIGLTQPLLVGLAMTLTVIMREADRAGTIQLGETVVEAQFDIYGAATRADSTRMPAVIRRLAGLPGVTAVLPRTGGYRVMRFHFPSGDGGERVINLRTHEVPPGYFKAMDIPLVSGREFTIDDRQSGLGPIIIGSDFATQLFGSEDPIGRRLAFPSMEKEGEKEQVTIIGVVPVDLVGRSEAGNGYRVFSGLYARRPSVLLIRTASPADPMIPTLRAVARAEAPMIPIRSMKTLAQIEREQRKEIIQATGASAAGGMIALMLAAIGLYAVVALSVGQRRREIGIRISLGAQPREVVALFFRSGLKVSLLGLIIGLPLSAAALKVLSTQAGMPRTNMSAIAVSVALIVVTVAALASWLPARRAAGVDPMIALRDG